MTNTLESRVHISIHAFACQVPFNNGMQRTVISVHTLVTSTRGLLTPCNGTMATTPNNKINSFMDDLKGMHPVVLAYTNPLLFLSLNITLTGSIHINSITGF
jgi:hypothetical protein